jgi:hypothetical protein
VLDIKQKVINLIGSYPGDYTGVIQLSEPVQVQLSRVEGFRDSLTFRCYDTLGLNLYIKKGLIGKKLSYNIHNVIFEFDNSKEISDLSKLQMPKRFENLLNELLSLESVKAMKELQIDTVFRPKVDSIASTYLYLSPSEWEILHWKVPSTIGEVEAGLLAEKFNLIRGLKERMPAGREASPQEFKSLFGGSMEQLLGLEDSPTSSTAKVELSGSNFF